MTTLSNLHEALAIWGRARVSGLPSDDWATFQTTTELARAARLLGSLLEPCPTCFGTGTMETDIPCPVCSGSGLQVSCQAIERAAAVLYTKKWGPSMSGSRPGAMEHDHAEAVLRALLFGDTP